MSNVRRGARDRESRARGKGQSARERPIVFCPCRDPRGLTRFSFLREAVCICVRMCVGERLCEMVDSRLACFCREAFFLVSGFFIERDSV